MAVLSFDPGAFFGAYTGEALSDWELIEEEKVWGIWLNGQRCFTTAHMFSLNDEKHYQIANSPIEDGGFISTDKVDTPYTGILQLVCDGTDKGGIVEDMIPSWFGARSHFGKGAVNKIQREFFDELQQRCGDLNQYVVRTPEGEVSRVNLVGWSRSKSTQQWCNMVAVSLFVQEVRSATTSGWAKGATSSQAVNQNVGTQNVTWKIGSFGGEQRA